MVRPCFLVLDPEHPGSISTRKLVIETAKFNVVTSYSGNEAIETLEQFPAVHGAVMDMRVTDMPIERLIERLKKIKRELVVVVIAAPGMERPAGADFVVESLSPSSLLDVLRTICPEETEYIERHDRELEEEGQ